MSGSDDRCGLVWTTDGELHGIQHCPTCVLDNEYDPQDEPCRCIVGSQHYVSDHASRE